MHAAAFPSCSLEPVGQRPASFLALLFYSFLCSVPMTNPITTETTAQSVLFDRFRNLALRFRDCGACVQNDWNWLIQDGHATEAELKASVDEACARLDNLAEQATNLGRRLRHFADTYKAPESANS